MCVTGEYNRGMQPGLKNLTGHFPRESYWRPAAIISDSAGRFAGARVGPSWNRTLSEMGMVVVSSTNAVDGIGHAFDAEGELFGNGGAALSGVFLRFADDLGWRTQAASAQRVRVGPPYSPGEHPCARTSARNA